MTANELRRKFNNEFGLKPWPKWYVVDVETLENCEEAVIQNLKDRGEPPIPYAGPHGGLLFKNVELLLAEPK